MSVFTKVSHAELQAFLRRYPVGEVIGFQGIGEGVENTNYYVDTVDMDVPDSNVWEPFGIGNAAGSTAYLLRTGRSMLLGGADWLRMVARGEIELVGEESESWLGVPLQSEGKTIGAIVVQSYVEDTKHTDADKELLEFVGHHIASALERTRLIDDTRQRNAELALINDVQRGLAMNLDMQAMYDLVGDRLQEIFDAQVVDIGVLDASAGLIHFPYTIEKGVRYPDEPIGVIGIACPSEHPLLGFVSLVGPAIATGNTTVVIPSEPHPLAATDFYSVLETSDVPDGVINIVTGDRDALSKVLAEHDDVDAVWYFGTRDGVRAVELASAANMKRTWATWHERDWLSRDDAEGREFLRAATQVKNVWVPYGE